MGHWGIYPPLVSHSFPHGSEILCLEAEHFSISIRAKISDTSCDGKTLVQQSSIVGDLL